MPLPDSRSLVWKWIALGASLCAFFGGLILAVIFLHAYVVPYRTEGGFIKQEQCIVESIENISIADQGGGLCTFGYSYDCRFCTVVLTRYRSKIEKVWVVGHLYHDVMVLLGRQTKAENKVCRSIISSNILIFQLRYLSSFEIPNKQLIVEKANLI